MGGGDKTTLPYRTQHKIARYILFSSLGTFHLQHKTSDIFPFISANHLCCSMLFHMIVTIWHSVFNFISLTFFLMHPAQFYVVSNMFSLLDTRLQIIHVSFVIVPHALFLLKLKNRNENEKIMYDKNIGQYILTLI
jgi:hypothetical protein